VSAVREIRWSASNTVSGVVRCVRTRAGWTAADGSVYGCGPSGTLFGAPPVPLSPRVMARVRRILAEVQS
jgi:hypothetical protein